MSFDARLLVISLATFVVAGTAASTVVPWLFRRMRFVSPQARAIALFRLRLLPVSAALVATAQGVVSFVVFEPRSQDEVFGRVLVGLATVGALLLVIGTARLGRAALSTGAALRRWLIGSESISFDGCPIPARIIDSEFPVVAVVGLIRPRLVIARIVLDACPPDEIRAILAHEMRHAARRDNLRRAVLTWLPDVLSLLPAGRRLIATWHDAAEAVADDASTDLGPAGRVSLASALLRVARIAPGVTMTALPASALYRGEDLGARVRRLLNPPAPAERAGLVGWRRAAMTGGLILSGGLALHAVHELVEAVVGFLP